MWLLKGYWQRQTFDDHWFIRKGLPATRRWHRSNFWGLQWTYRCSLCYHTLLRMLLGTAYRGRWARRLGFQCGVQQAALSNGKGAFHMLQDKVAAAEVILQILDYSERLDWTNFPAYSITLGKSVYLVYLVLVLFRPSSSYIFCIYKVYTKYMYDPDVGW